MHRSVDRVGEGHHGGGLCSFEAVERLTLTPRKVSVIVSATNAKGRVMVIAGPSLVLCPVRGMAKATSCNGSSVSPFRTRRP